MVWRGVGGWLFQNILLVEESVRSARLPLPDLWWLSPYTKSMRRGRPLFVVVYESILISLYDVMVPLSYSDLKNVKKNPPSFKQAYGTTLFLVFIKTLWNRKVVCVDYWDSWGGVEGGGGNIVISQDSFGSFWIKCVNFGDLFTWN